MIKNSKDQDRQRQRHQKNPTSRNLNVDSPQGYYLLRSVACLRRDDNGKNFMYLFLLLLVILVVHNYNSLMQITPIKTHALLPEKDNDILTVLDQYIGSAKQNSSERGSRIKSGMTGKVAVKEGSVLAVTSKIVSICEGRFVPVEGTDKDALIASESQMYIPRTLSKYNYTVTITNNILGASAGIDSSNGNGYYILWPKDAQASANKIREHIAKRLGLRDFGVVITDSKTTSMRWGVTGLALAHSGFVALKDYIGTPDIFGREFEFEKLNIADCLATAGVLVMGEGKEQTPLAVISDIPLISFQDRNPSEEELENLKIEIDDDVYGDFLKNAPWVNGKK